MSLTKTLLQCCFLIFHLLSISTTAKNTALDYEIPTIIKVFKNGTVKRLFGTKTVPASYDPKTGVVSKDVYISRELNISARLYRPENATAGCKLPVLVYFHGGAFFSESAFSPTYHNHLNSLVSKANIVGVSVNYRLAPEHPLPIAYQDSWHALQWVFSHIRGTASGSYEAWLENYVDSNKVYLGGDSAGGNIAHNMAIRAGLEKMDQINLEGMFLNCPRFWGEVLIGNESKYPKRVAIVESIWVHAYPNSMGFDDPLLNPLKEPNLSKLGCKRVLVYLAEKDIYRDRDWSYVKALNDSNWGGVVDGVEVQGEDHVFNLNFPNSSNAKNMLEHLALFLHQGGLRKKKKNGFGPISVGSYSASPFSSAQAPTGP